MLALPPDAAFLDALIGELRGRTPSSKDELQRLKLRLARTHGLRGLPNDASILAAIPREMHEGLRDVLRVKPARTASGVAVVTVMTAPHACPHGVCTYCPGGPRFGTPQSYLGTEPAAMRAAEYRYDPCAQTVARLRSLRANGHETDKVDLIVIGGTFTALETAYQEWFVKGCLDGMNGSVAGSLEEAQTANENAGVRCIGLTIETKPDCFLGAEVEASVRLGTTRVELGIQSTHDDVLERVHRGHTDADSRAAMARAKDVGLKVGAHMMPGLPEDLSDARPPGHRALRPLEIRSICASADGRGGRARGPDQGDRAAVVPHSEGAAGDRRGRHRGRCEARRPARPREGATPPCRPPLSLHPLPRSRAARGRPATRKALPRSRRVRVLGRHRGVPERRGPSAGRTRRVRAHEGGPGGGHCARIEGVRTDRAHPLGGAG